MEGPRVAGWTSLGASLVNNLIRFAGEHIWRIM